MKYSSADKGLTTNKGFTMLEVLITIAILSIVLAAAAPSFKQFVESRKIQQRVSTISDMLNTGRSIALSKGATSFVCWNGSANNASLPAPDNSVVLEPQQMVVIDNSETDQDARLVNRIAFPVNESLNIVDDQGGGGATCVSFNSQGRSNNTANVVVCKDGGSEANAYTVSLNVNGRSSNQKGNTTRGGVSCV